MSGLCLLAVTALVLGPALVASRIPPAGLLRSGAGSRVSPGRQRVQGWVLALQSALWVFLLVAAGVSVGRVAELLDTDPGFRGTDALTFRVPLPEARYPTAEARQVYLDEVTEALASIPGVAAVGAVDILPVGDPGARYSFSVEDHPPDDPSAFEVARGRLTTPGYLEALGLELLAGRFFEPSDDASSEPVVVVSRALADRYWPGREAVGRRLKRRSWNSPFPWMRVVGVVGDLRDDGLGAPVGPTLYLAYPQHDTRLGREMSFVVRGGGPADRLADLGRARIRSVDARTPVTRVARADELLRQSWSAQRAAGMLLSGFGGGALLLLALGVYGVMARAVQERRREVGLRVALGALPGEVALHVMARAMGLLAAGVAAGLLVIWAVERTVPRILVGPSSWWTVALAAALPIVVGLLASARPAIRAVRIDPVRALEGS